MHTEREKKREKENTVCNSCFCAPFFLFFFPPPSPRENDLFNRSESVVIEQFKRRANWSRFSDNGWPINNPGRGWFWVVVNLFPSMAVQEPGECQGQHSRYHWPPAITPEALSRVRLRSHIRRKRNGPTARYRYLSVDNVANLCCGTCTRAKYFHPHLDSQNFHGSRLLGSRVATIPFPINRNVHFSFLSFLFLLLSRAELPSKPCLSLSFFLRKEKNIKISIFIFQGEIKQDLDLVSRRFFVSAGKGTDSSLARRSESLFAHRSSDVIGISIRTFRRGFIFNLSRATGDEKDGRKTVTERFVRL